MHSMSVFIPQNVTLRSITVLRLCIPISDYSSYVNISLWNFQRHLKNANQENTHVFVLLYTSTLNMLKRIFKKTNDWFQKPNEYSAFKYLKPPKSVSTSE